MRSCQYLIPLILASLTVRDAFSVPARRSQHEELKSESGDVAQWDFNSSRLLRSGDDKDTADEERMKAPTLRSAVMRVMKNINLLKEKVLDGTERFLANANFASVKEIVNRYDNGILVALMSGYHPLQLKTWLEHDAKLATNMAISLTHWNRNEDTKFLLSFIEGQRTLLRDLEPGTEAVEELWNKIYPTLRAFERECVFENVEKTTSLFNEGVSAEELLTRGVSPFLYWRELEIQAAKMKKTLQHNEFMAWYDKKLKTWETFVEAYEKRLKMPPMFAVLPEFKSFEGKDVAAIWGS